MRQSHTLIAIAIGALQCTAQAATYDLATDRLPNANPNGPWSFRSGDTVLPWHNSVCCLGFSAGGYAPRATAGGFLPLFFQRQPGGDVGLHTYDPGNGRQSSGEANLVWTATATGQLDIDLYLYWSQAPLQRSNDYTLLLGNQVLASGTLSHLLHNGYANRQTLSFDDLLINQGDPLRLVFKRSPGQFSGSFSYMGMRLEVTPVPEPSTYALMLSGLAGIGFVARRRR